MPQQLLHIRIEVHDKLYLKDPRTSSLGKELLEKGLLMIDALGIEGFTFRKLSSEIGTTESAVYRYFENKHKMLLYFVSWYWAWLDYQIAFGVANMECPKQELARAIQIVTRDVQPGSNDFLNVEVLHRVVVAESSKSYLTKVVDQENKEGLFIQYKALCKRLGRIIAEVNPKYPYPNSLASMLIEAQLEQVYFSEHLPSLSEVGGNEASREEFFKSLIFHTLEAWPK